MASFAHWTSVIVGALLASSLLPATANAQGAQNAPAVAPPTEGEQAALPPKSNLYLRLNAGLGYAALSEDRSSAQSSSNAREVSATGLGVQVYGALGHRVTPKVAIGGALSLIVQPSPAIDYELIGAGTPVVEDGGAVGGFVGPMIALQLSETVEFNAALGYGGFGRSSPNPGFGGRGGLLSVAADYLVSTSPSLAIVVGLRLTAGLMTHDGDEDGTYSSSLILPALMAGIAFH